MRKKFTKIQIIIVSICFALFFFGMAAGSSAADYYMAPNGLDAASGSITAPWKTLKESSKKLVAGDRLFIRGGTYTLDKGVVWTATLGTASNPIIVKNYANEVPVFEGGNTTSGCFRTIASKYTIWDGLTFQNFRALSTGAIWIGYSGSGTNYAVGNTVRNCVFINIGSTTSPHKNHAVYISYGVTDMTVNNNRFYNISGGAVHQYHGPGLQRGKIYNNLVFKALWAVILADGARDVEIYNNLIVDCGKALNGGVELNYSGQGETAARGNINTIVRNNIFHSNFLAVNTGSQAVNPTISNNLFFNNTNIGNQGTSAVLADPQFVNFQLNGTGDYHLQATSPAINAGLANGAPFTDYDGVIRLGLPDIGPYEYAGSCPYPEAPKAPKHLSATGTSSSTIDLVWLGKTKKVKNKDEDEPNNVSSYLVERSTNDSTGFKMIANLTADAESFSDVGLKAGITYYYRVSAINCFGTSEYSDVASGTPICLLTSVPDAPLNTAATVASSSQINLTWADNSSNEDNWLVERSTSATTGFVEIASLPANTAAYNNAGLSGSTTYYYRVRAVNCFGFSTYSDVVSGTTPVACSAPSVPNPPLNTAASAVSSSQINITWTDNSGLESAWLIERSTSATTGFVQIVQLGPVTPTAPSNTSYSNTGLAAGTTYYYRVRASNCFGFSSYSAVVSATTASVIMSVKSSVTSSNEDVNEPVSNQISVYPNPSVTSFTLTIPSDVVISGGLMRIYDKNGKEVKSVSIKSNITTIGRGSLQSGIYYYHIINNNEKIYNGKLMISNEN